MRGSNYLLESSPAQVILDLPLSLKHIYSFHHFSSLRVLLLSELFTVSC